MLRRGWIAGVLGIVGAVLGCTAQPAQKTLIVQCDPKNPSSECADTSLERPKKSPLPIVSASDGTFPPSPPPNPAPAPDAGSAATPDAGVDASSAGVECKALRSCCDALRKAGFDGSAALCDRTVDAGEETACRTMHDDNKKPIDETDFVCE